MALPGSSSIELVGLELDVAAEFDSRQLRSVCLLFYEVAAVRSSEASEVLWECFQTERLPNELTKSLRRVLKK